MHWGLTRSVIMSALNSHNDYMDPNIMPVLGSQTKLKTNEDWDF